MDSYAVHRLYSTLPLGGPPQLTRVTMVQSSDSRKHDDLAHSWRFDRSLFGSVLLKSEMCSVFVVVGDIQLNHSAKLRLIDRDNMLEPKSINSITKFAP